VDINSAVGRKAGLSDEKLRAVLGGDRTIFTDMERLVIELADALSETPSNVDDAFYGRLSQRFSEEQLIELGAQIAFEQYRARLNRLFDVGSDGLYSPRATPSGPGTPPH
jgi:alkylhydroperoxidase family enzyme